MIDISETMSCAVCSNVLESPLVLPCGHSICKVHLTISLTMSTSDELSSSSSQPSDPKKRRANQERKTKIFCVKCDTDQEVGENGLPVNKLAEELLSHKLHKIEFCEKYKEATNAFKKLDAFINECELFARDAESEIADTIGDIKRRVDLCREQLKARIDHNALEMIKDLETFEMECREPFEIKRFEELKDGFVKTHLSLAKEESRQWLASLNSFENNRDVWIKIADQSQKRVKDLCQVMTALHSELFLNRLHEFELKQLNFWNLQDQRIIKFRIDKVNSYKSQSISVYSEPQIVFGSEFKIEVKFSKTREDDSVIGIYVHYVPQSAYYSALVDYDVMIPPKYGKDFPTQTRKDYPTWLGDQFEFHGNRTKSRYIEIFSLNQLMTRGELYNSRDDSIDLEIKINDIQFRRL